MDMELLVTTATPWLGTPVTVAILPEVPAIARHMNPRP
jgi:hypothetical protein